MSDFRNPSDQEIEPEELDLSTEELDTQVQKAQEQLLELRRRQEQIEKEKEKLEELSRKQDELDQGRGEMIDKMNRALAVIHRESTETEKRREQLRNIQDTFSSHLHYLEEINMKTWNGPELPRELSKALSGLDDARAEYEKLYPKVSVGAEEEVAYAHGVGSAEYEDMYASGGKSFFYWFMMGFAFTLPLLILGVIALITLFWHLASHP